MILALYFWAAAIPASAIASATYPSGFSLLGTDSLLSPVNAESTAILRTKQSGALEQRILFPTPKLCDDEVTFVIQLGKDILTANSTSSSPAAVVLDLLDSLRNNFPELSKDPSNKPALALLRVVDSVTNETDLCNSTSDNDFAGHLWPLSEDELSNDAAILFLVENLARIKISFATLTDLAAIPFNLKQGRHTLPPTVVHVLTTFGPPGAPKASHKPQTRHTLALAIPPKTNLTLVEAEGVLWIADECGGQKWASEELLAGFLKAHPRCHGKVLYDVVIPMLYHFGCNTTERIASKQFSLALSARDHFLDLAPGPRSAVLKSVTFDHGGEDCERQVSMELFVLPPTVDGHVCAKEESLHRRLKSVALVGRHTELSLLMKVGDLNRLVFRGSLGEARCVEAANVTLGVVDVV